jgi:tRNA(Glu) U13 pseudouridine synthase TruD
LPEELKKAIENFKIDGYAKKYFGTQRKGIFRKKVPLEKMLVYQKVILSYLGFN